MVDCQKLHEDERSWTKKGAHIPSAPFGPANDYALTNVVYPGIYLALKGKRLRKPYYYLNNMGLLYNMVA